MKLFVATQETQGKRKNDFCWVPEGEPLRFGSECDFETVDGNCGCRRSLSGMKCHKATTTFKVIDDPSITIDEYCNMIKNSLVSGGWGQFNTTEDMDTWANTDARELARLASLFPVGAILERRGDDFNVRRVPAEAK